MTILLWLVLQDAEGLIRQLGDEDPGLRDKAESRLLEMGAKSIDAVEAARTRVSDPEVRLRLERILGAQRYVETLGVQGARDYAGAGGWEEKLRVLIRHKDRLGGAAPPWLANELLTDSHDAEQKGRLLQSIREHGLRAAARIAAILLKDAEAAVRAHAVETLGMLDAREFEPAAVEMLSDPAGEVRESAIRALSSLWRKRSPADALRVGLRTDSEKKVKEMLSRGREGLVELLDVFCPLGLPADARKRIASAVEDLATGDPKLVKAAYLSLSELGSDSWDSIARVTDARARPWLDALTQDWRDHVMLPEHVAEEVGRALGATEHPDVLARRAVDVLSSPSFDPESRSFVRHLIPPLASRDAEVETLAKLLDHPDPRVPVQMLRWTGPQTNTHFPEIVLIALGSKRPEIVDAAQRSGPAPIWDEKKRRRIHKAMKNVFETGTEAQKFYSCFTLMQTFRDRDAVAYLLEQTRSKDRERIQTALGWLGDSCNWGRRATPAILEAFRPHLQSKDSNLRLMAGYGLGTYSGDEVVRALIPLLVDPEEIIRIEVSNKLLGARDQKPVLQVLEEALKGEKDEGLRKALSELIERFGY
jgi:hypothetical protein